MAIVNLVSNLRAYNPKFSDFGVNQVVDQPIPAEPNRTAPSNLDRRKDDFRRLKAFLTSGKGLTFAAKQAGLDQAVRDTSIRERAGEVANTAARLANIALQAGPPGEIARFSSHPFVRYIEARDLVGQIGNLLRADAPSLAKRGRTIIPDYEVEDERSRIANQETENKIREFIKNKPGLSKFFGNVGKVKDFYNNVKGLNSLPDNVDKDPTSIKSTLDSEGSKFDKPVNEGYVVDAVDSREDLGKTLISDLSVDNKVDDTIVRPNSYIRSRLSSTDLKPGFNILLSNLDYYNTDSIRTKARRAGRDTNGRFRDRAPYITDLGDLSNPEKNSNNNLKLKFDAYTAKYAGEIRPIEFTATLEDFSDSYSSNWNNTQYIGRGEPVYNFNSTSRTIGFSFKAYSTSARDVRDLYKRLNQLASYTNPTYTGTFMAGTFIKLTLGDYLIATPGFLTGVDFKWQTSYPWEVTGAEKSISDLGIDEISNIPKLPHILDVSIRFTPIHNFIPEANPKTVNRPFIASNSLVNIPPVVTPGPDSTSEATDSVSVISPTTPIVAPSLGSIPLTNVAQNPQ